MQRADLTKPFAGHPGYFRFRLLAFIAILVIPVAFAARAEEPKAKRVIRNVTPDSIPIIVLPPRASDVKPAPAEDNSAGERMIATVGEDGTIRANARRLVLAGATAIPADTLCQSPTHGRWACGVRAYVALRTMVHGKELKCATVREVDDGFTARCYGTNTDISHRLLSEGWALYDPATGETLLSDAAEDARRNSRGIWQNGSRPLLGINP